MGIDLIRSFLEKATASGSRSTALTDLRWLIGMFLGALFVAFKLGAPSWILIFIVVVLIVACVIYVAAYIFFAFKTPDALRSERFTLSKLAIERSVTGDNLAGFIDPTIDSRPLPASQPNEGHS